MLISELLLSTLPSDRMYEFNLNYILKAVRDLDIQYKEKLHELVKQYVEEFLTTFELEYIDSTETIKLKGVVIWANRKKFLLKSKVRSTE